MGVLPISQKNIYNIPSCASQNLTPNLSSLQYRVVTFKSACNHCLRASPMKKKTAFTRDYLKLKDAICFLGWKEKISPRKRDSCSFCVRESSQAIKNISCILTPFLGPRGPFRVPSVPVSGSVPKSQPMHFYYKSNTELQNVKTFKYNFAPILQLIQDLPWNLKALIGFTPNIYAALSWIEKKPTHFWC